MGKGGTVRVAGGAGRGAIRGKPSALPGPLQSTAVFGLSDAGCGLGGTLSL